MADVDDKDVSALIDNVQSALNKLRAAQSKDEGDEKGDDQESLPGGGSGTEDRRADKEQPPKTIKEAGARHVKMLAANPNRRQD